MCWTPLRPGTVWFRTRLCLGAWQMCRLSNSGKPCSPLATAWEVRSVADSPLGQRGWCQGVAAFAVGQQAGVSAEGAVLQGLQPDGQVAAVEDVVAVYFHPEVCSRGVPGLDATSYGMWSAQYTMEIAEGHQ